MSTETKEQAVNKGPGALHPHYMANQPKWARCRVAAAGEDDVKAAAELYLPRLGGQDAQPSTDWASRDPYEAYKARAMFYEATARTVEVLVGCAIRKPHTLEASPSVQLKELGGDGQDADSFVAMLLGEVITTGRAGVLVDLPEDGAADAEPVARIYCAESIRNWITDGETLSALVLAEKVSVPDPSDETGLGQQEVDQLRVVRLRDGAVTVQLYRLANGSEGTGQKDQWEAFGEEITPTIRGAALKEIPWAWAGAVRANAEVDKPPLLGLVNVNLSHYRTSADLEHGRHFTALPTPWVAGAVVQDGPLLIGSTAAWALKEGGQAGYLEFRGDGLGSLERALAHKEELMAQLGARLLMQQKRAAETAETARINQGGQSAGLQVVVASVEQTMDRVLRLVSRMTPGAEEGAVEVRLNRDFVDITMEPARLTALVQALQAGAISHDTFLWNLAQAEVLPPGTDPEDEKAAIAADDDAAMARLKAAGLPGPGAQAAPAGGEAEPGAEGGGGQDPGDQDAGRAKGGKGAKPPAKGRGTPAPPQVGRA